MKSAVSLLCVVLAGCATVPDPMSTTERHEAHSPIACTSKAQCDVMWQRAQVYVANHAGFKMQTVSDSIISTFGPANISGLTTKLAWTVTRLPTMSGGASITARADCANLWCYPDPDNSLLEFRRFVMAP